MPRPARRRVVVAIAVPVEPELVGTIRTTDDRLDVRYQPDLFPPLRYPGEHRGIDGFRRTQDQETRWQRMLYGAEVVLGLPDSVLADLVRTNPGLRWVQATTGGVGEQVRSSGLTSEELERVRITGASCVHAVPLAEFAMFGVLAFAKQLPHLLVDARARRWDHHPMHELAGQTLLVIGLGSIGAEVAQLAKAFGMHVLAVNSTGRGEDPNVDEIRPPRFLGDLLPVAHAVVVALPSTPRTRGMIDDRLIRRMRLDAVLVNVGSGGVIDEQALVRGLERGAPAAAVLDVFETEHLPADSPLWDLPNVLISPHTAASSAQENARIVALFTENLRRYLRGDELIGRVRPVVA